jgi:hypothetical protein
LRGEHGPRPVGVAAGLGDRRPVHRNHRRQFPYFRFPIRGSAYQRDVAGHGQGPNRVEARFCGVQPRFDAVDITLGQTTPAHERGQQRAATNDALVQARGPLAQRGVLAPPALITQAELDQVSGVLVVVPRERVVNGVGEQPVLGQPAPGGSVQLLRSSRVVG